MHSWELAEDDVQWPELWSKWDEQKEDDFIEQVKRGMEGNNMGMDNGLTHANQYLQGTHKGRYILVGADSGVGKTTFVDFAYLYSLWIYCKAHGIKLYIKYFSFELSKTEKKARWVCQWIKKMYNKEFSSNYILGRIPDRQLTKDDLKLVLRAYAVVEEVMSDMVIIDHMLHPTGMLNVFIEDHFEKIGEVFRAPAREEGKKGMIIGYKPNDPRAVTIGIVDHVALINHEGSANTAKAIIDRWSMYSVQLRNLFQCIIINIQQFSTSMMGAYRDRGKSESAIAPQRLDFGDSTYTFRDADVVMGMVKPIEFNIQVFNGFQLDRLGQYFVLLYLMKNRYGPANHILPLFMNPISGMFYNIHPDPYAVQEDGNTPAINRYIEEAKRLDNL